MSTAELEPRVASIPGIEIIEEIGRGAFGIVYRAQRGERALAVKVFEPVGGDFASERAARFRREAASLACLRHEALPEVVDAGQADGRPYLVMDYVDGTPLSTLLRRGHLSPDDVVRLLSDLAGALAEVHRHGLVHRDVSPQNIIRMPDGSCKLVDFGLARWLQSEAPTQEVAGSFLYAAPEQTGVLKRPLDGRADLYALGAVAFEAATGRPPFQASSTAEVLHQHAVGTPPKVSDINPGFPAAPAAIIAKLLAKDPDDRYQSGEALSADLSRVDSLGRSLSVGRPIQLGDHGTTHSGPAQTFVGRHEQIELLTEAWSKARKVGGIVQIEGDAGSGKSRLAREFMTRLEQRGATLFSGGCTANDVTPLLPLRRAFETALAHPENDGDETDADVIGMLRRAGEGLAPFLSRLTPAFRGLFPDHSEALESLELHEQFFDAVADFLLRLARDRPGTVLFIDDGQWLDEASRQVLRRLARHIHDAPLLVVVSTRPIEEGNTLLDFLSAATPLCLMLPPFDDQAVADLVAANLGGYSLDAAVAGQIAKRSGGNAFAVIEYVRAMLDGGMLRPSWNGWVVDGEHDVLPMSQDVVKLVIQRLSDLEDASRMVLRVAALMGSRFHAEVLSHACKTERATVDNAMAQAMLSGLIERSSPGTFAFSHDRIREALQSDIGSLERSQLHARIAEAYETVGGNDPQHVFAIARHYKMAQAPDPNHLYEVNLAAGLEAVAQLADAIAFGFLDDARQVARTSGHVLDMALVKTLGEVCARTGRLDEAVEHLEAALGLATGPVERAEILRRLGSVHLANYNNSRTWAAVNQAFKELGRPRVRSSVWATLASFVRAGLSGVASFLGLGSRARTNDERHRLRVLLDVYNTVAVLGYFSADDHVMVQSAILAFSESRRLGPSRGLVDGYASISVLLATLRLRRPALWMARRARRIAASIDDPRALAQAKIYTAFCYQILGEGRIGEKITRRCLDEYGPWVDITYYENGCWSVGWGLMLRGYMHESWAWISRALDRAEMSATPDGAMQASWSYGAPIFAALGEPGQAVQYLERSEALADTEMDEVYRRADFLGHKLLYCVEQEEWGLGAEVVDEFQTLGMKASRTEMHLRHFYVGRAHLRLHEAEATAPAERAMPLKRLIAAVKDLRKAAVIPLLEAHRLVIEAGFLRLEGRFEKAEGKLHRAGRVADEADSPWVWFEIGRQRALLRQKAGDQVAAERHARKAEALALRHGWIGRLQRLRAEFRLEDSFGPTPRTGSKRIDATGDLDSLRLRRQMEALLQMSSAAATVHDPNQRAHIALDQLVKLLGAERAFLFLADPQTGELELSASCDADGGSGDHAPYSSTVINRVRATRAPIVVAGSEEGEVLGSTSIVAHDLRSIIAAPLMMKESMVGVVYLDNRLAKGVFTESDVEILLAMGSHIAIALESARATQLEVRVEAEHEQRRLAEKLNAFVASLSASLDLGNVLDRLVDELCQMLAADQAAVLLQEGDALRVAALRGYGEDSETASQQLEASIGTDGRLQALLSRVETMTDPPLGEAGAQRGNRVAWMGIPLRTRDSLQGFLVLERGSPLFERSEIELATMFAGQASITIENARLFAQVNELATTDGLTGVANRRHFYYLAERELVQAKRYGRPMALVMADIDKFKAINDTYGHAAGDDVLKEVARRFLASLRDCDLSARYGGEEFVFLLPNTKLDVARDSIAERLRMAVSAEPIQTLAGDIGVTVSFGVCGDSTGATPLAELLKGADEALYAAKHAGRNRVMEYEAQPQA